MCIWYMGTEIAGVLVYFMIIVAIGWIIVKDWISWSGGCLASDESMLNLNNLSNVITPVLFKIMDSLGNVN